MIDRTIKCVLFVFSFHQTESVLKEKEMETSSPFSGCTTHLLDNPEMETSFQEKRRNNILAAYQITINLHDIELSISHYGLVYHQFQRRFLKCIGFLFDAFTKIQSVL